MSARRALATSLIVLTAGVAVLSAATNGFRAFTTETARRLDIEANPRAVPEVPLEGVDGRATSFEALRGRWLLVEFMYTRCTTYCAVQGREFARLQDRLATPIADGHVSLLSISFDPTWDTPERLAEYQHHSGDRGAGWIATRPGDRPGLDSLTRVFGVTVVPDGLGGYVHNAAIAVVDPAGQLIRIVDWNDTDVAARFVLDRLAP